MAPRRTRTHTRILARGDALRIERLSQGWTAADFSARIGITRAHLSVVELRKRGLSDEVAIKILSVLQARNPELSFDDIFEIDRNGAGHRNGEQLALLR